MSFESVWSAEQDSAGAIRGEAVEVNIGMEINIGTRGLVATVDHMHMTFLFQVIDNCTY